MLGNFSYSNHTRLHFGKDSLQQLTAELQAVGPRVLLVYGGGSIKRNGIYDRVAALLREAGKEIVELGGVMANPTVDKLYEGARVAREHNVDFILAVGGGSVCDYSKAVSVSAWCDADPWEKYFLHQEEPAPGCRILPVGCVLTMVGTGSEMNAGAVITNPAQKLKIGKVFGDGVMPVFAILNPEFTYTLPRYQMVAGWFDIMSHIMEQYFSGTDDNTSDYMAEALMRSLVHSSLIAAGEPHNYEARSNIMWTATWALNTLIGKGKTQDWMVHMIGQSVGAYTNATHGMTLSAVSLAYYRHIMSCGLPKFVRFARNVWGVSGKGMTDSETAKAGLDALEQWMRQVGVVMSLKELGVTENMLDGIADGTFVFDGGYKTLTHAEIVEILKESM